MSNSLSAFFVFVTLTMHYFGIVNLRCINLLNNMRKISVLNLKWKENWIVGFFVCFTHVTASVIKMASFKFIFLWFQKYRWKIVNTVSFQENCYYFPSSIETIKNTIVRNCLFAMIYKLNILILFTKAFSYTNKCIQPAM